MLFAKKEKDAIDENVLKKELCSEDGKTLVRVNLKAPSVKCASRRDPLLKHARPFYESLFKTFGDYACTELLQAAKTRCDTEGFAPFAAVMGWELTFFSDEYLSLLITVSVSDGVGGDREYRPQIWDRRTGNRCVFYDFFLPGGVETVAAELFGDEKKRFDKELFVLGDKGFEFIVRSENGDPVRRILPAGLLEEKGVLKKGSLFGKNRFCS